MNTATDSIKELRQIVHEILEEGVNASHEKWVNNTFYGWQASVWTMDPTIWPPIQLVDNQVYVPKVSMALSHISVSFEQNVKSLKICIDAPQFTASRSEDLAEPNSILRLGRWLADAMKFALRDVQFPA